VRPLSLKSLTIGSKCADDADFIRGLSEQVFGEYTAAAGAHTLGLSEHPRATTLVARVGTRPVGFAILSLDDPTATLTAIAVEPRSRGVGVARRLLSAIERAAAERGALSMKLATAEANLAALDLFLKAGYQRSGRLLRYYGRGQNALGLQKYLRRT
jgi:ribosomal protein S18 acetylase RimI-like enzyme